MGFPKEVTDKYEQFIKDHHDLVDTIFTMIEQRFKDCSNDYYIFSFLICEFIIEKIADETVLNGDKIDRFCAALDVLIEGIGFAKFKAMNSEKIMKVEN